ncbi:MAG: DUF294 nucleotidyltransferase-like domain-containing protein [Pseudomonadota bacterium]
MMDAKTQPDAEEIAAFLADLPPYDGLDEGALAALAAAVEPVEAKAGDAIYDAGEPLAGLYLIVSGEVEARDALAAAALGPRASFGERGLLRGGHAVTNARAVTDASLLLIPRSVFDALLADHPRLARFFERSGAAPAPAEPSLSTALVSTMMTERPLTCAPEATVAEAARRMRDARVSCLPVVGGESGEALIGVVTLRDLVGKALAEGMPGDAPVSAVMTQDPAFLPPDALSADVVSRMAELGVGHIPIVEAGRLVGIVTQTDLTRRQAMSSGAMLAAAMAAPEVDALAAVTRGLPELLGRLVAGGARHDAVTRLVTDVADAATRRLIAIGEATLGPPPAPYLWLACGSQGRREQTGVSDQDNCMILSDDTREEDMGWFAALARFVSDGLDACGYYYCPGDMMATNPRWMRPLRVWREYFLGWIRKPDPMAQMLASVMFDLRPIAGDDRLFEGLKQETLAAASGDTIFIAHMAANALKHQPPLGLFRGLSMIRSGEHKNTLDLKLGGVTPIVDLGRIYAIQGALEPVNTRARLVAAMEAGIVSASGGRDLIDAYDLIASQRLAHQAEQIRAGRRPDNYVAPGGLSDLQKEHLRDAFGVVKTMQSALGHSRATAV